MARFTYSPVAPFDAPPVGGLSYIAVILPISLPDAHVTPGKLRLDGAMTASITFTGSGFGLSVEAGVPDVTAGSITGMTMRYDGRQVLQVTGLKVDAEALYNFIQADNFIGYFNLLARGDDRVDGTGLADALTGWTGNDTVYGGGGSDSLDGYNGADSLYGGRGGDTMIGGAGQDRLFGGAGADLFVFNDNAALNSHDVIGDFKPGVDEFQLDNDVFTTIGPVDTLAAEAFRTGSAAQDGDDRIIYQKSTGWVFYDPDGSGGAAKIAFAKVTAGLHLTASDFVIFE